MKVSSVVVTCTVTYGRQNDVSSVVSVSKI